MPFDRNYETIVEQAGRLSSTANQGIMLEYETFYRPKYQPEENVWPLLEQMVATGLSRQVAIATDMADARLWARKGDGPGLSGLITQITPRLENLGIPTEIIHGLVGQNIAARLACPCYLPTQNRRECR